MWGVPATEGTVPSSSSTRTPHADEVSRVSKTYESLVKQKEDALDSYTKLCESTGTKIDPAIDKFRWQQTLRRQLGIIESASTILRKEGSRASKDA
nr:uncharacterized protein I203_06714 [Kwoniella mangroviensis CBS 8507]OCF64130.1 hypothetical protein I203_06714 [Kwoniella mangroviensis CBS 8507]